MKLLDLALKDIRQIMRDKRSLLFLVAMPIIFTLFMGFAYRGSSTSAEQPDSRLVLAVVNPRPDTRLNQAFLARLQVSKAINPMQMDEADAMQALYKGEAAGVLMIPPDFDQMAQAGKTPQFTLISEANSTQGQSLYQSLRGEISRLMGTVETARISADLQANPDEFLPAFDLAWEKWNSNSRLELVRSELAVAAETTSSDWTGGNPYNQSSPGVLVQFAIFGLISSAQIVVQERKTGTLQRLMTTAMPPWQIVAAHLLAMFLLIFLQTIMLVVFGQIVLAVNYLREPAGTLIVAVTLSLWVAAVGLLIGVVAKEEQQVILYSMIFMFLFSALGGTWFPLESSGGAFAAIGRLMPSAWAMTGFQNILIRGLGLNSVWLPAAILLGYALVFFGAGVWRFRKIIK